jgi:hypothetical protein
LSFRLFGRKPAERPEAAAERANAASPSDGEAASAFRIVFDGLTEEWRLFGMMEISERLSDTLNAGGPLKVMDISWAPSDGSRPLEPAPAFRSVAAEDFVIVFAGYDTIPRKPDGTPRWPAHAKESHGLRLLAGPFAISGRVFFEPGEGPEQLLQPEGGPLFIPVVSADVRLGERHIGDPAVEVALVNRRALTRVERHVKPEREASLEG